MGAGDAGDDEEPADGGGGQPVQAVDRYRNNGHLIAAAARLGHLGADWLTLDPTYGKGTFWSVFRPARLVTNDLDGEAGAAHRFDFRDLPRKWGETFDAVAFDPPYGLRGTVTEENGGYGLGDYMTVNARHTLMRFGLIECARVARTGGRVLAKCQDQVCEGRLHWQTIMLYETGRNCGLRLAERLDYAGGRKQPDRYRWRCLACGRENTGPQHACRQAKAAGYARREQDGEAENPDRPWLARYRGRQVHAYNRPSSLLIFEKVGE